jgi:hypothetical protein
MGGKTVDLTDVKEALPTYLISVYFARREDVLLTLVGVLKF